MRKVHIESVQPGARVARPIYTENGSVLLGTGIELTPRYIERLKTMGIDTVYIDDPETSDIIPEDPIRDSTRREAIEAAHRTMTTLFKSPDARRRTSVPDLGRTFRDVFGKIVEDLLGKKDVLVRLTNIHTSDGYLFHHSVNVAVLAGIIGLSKGYNMQQMTELGVGALLYDIGMTLVPKELWSRPGPLTEEELRLLQRHTEDGFNLLRSCHDVSLLSAHCALQHHERYDGTGYPRGLKSREIHEYAQIVALADVHDALTSPRPYRQRYTPSEATEYLFAVGNSMFDPELIKLFLRHIAVYPLASTVRLSTGQIGVVSAVHPLAPHRPTVRILEEADGQKTKSPYEIDLRNETTITIVSLL